MRLTLVISSLGCGGAERVLCALADAWAIRGWDITVITVASSDKDFYTLHESVNRQSLDLIRPSKNRMEGIWFNGVRVIRLRKAIKAARPDAVISFMDFTNVRTLFATIGLKIPVVVSERNAPSKKKVGRLWGTLRNGSYRLATGIVVQTDRVKAYFPHALQSRIHVIPNPVLQVNVQRVPETHFCVTAMGSLTQQKAFPFLLRAFAEVAISHPKWCLRVVGEGPEREELSCLIADMNVGDRVELCGRLRRPESVLSRSDIFVLSSNYEGFPNALLEAMSMGLACISTDCETGPREIVRDGETGLLVPVQNVCGLSHALDRFMEDEALRVQIGDAARSDVLARFSLQSVLKQWESLVS